MIELVQSAAVLVLAIGQLCIVVALLRHLRRRPVVTAGRCGATPPPLRFTPDVARITVSCALPAGHAGWHKSDAIAGVCTEWGRRNA
jgi:hypothetical protein